MSCKIISQNKGIFLVLTLITFFLFNITLVFAELNYTTGESIYGIMADGSTTGSLNITFQIRSCNDSLCSGETFVGPDNTSSTYFTNETYNVLNETLTPNNTYFQYKAFFYTEDQNYTPMLFNVSIGYTYIDETKPLISFEEPTPSNNSGRTSEFELNVSITEQYLANVTYNWNGANTTYNSSDSELTDLGSGNWMFNLTQTGLVIGQSYTYQVFVTDFAGNSNSTELRTIKGNSAPTFISISHTPTSTDDIDPNVLINITANVSDTDNNFDSAILQYKNSTSNWTNVTMSNLTAKGLYTLMNANFTPDNEDNWTYRIWANDTQGDSTTSSNTSLNASWDCTWTATSDLGSIAGWDENKNIGNIIINNTGDSEFADSNCSLDFRLTYDLEDERIYFDNLWYKPSSTYTLSAGIAQNISVNATFFNTAKQEDVIITTEEISSRSNTSARNTTVTLVSNQAGPYLYQKVTSSPSTLYLTPQNFSLEGYLRNLMGSATVNENNTAYNVTFNWTLASGLTNVSGNLNTNFTNITDNELHYNNINVSFSNLASMTSGVKAVYLYASGVNLTGNAIADANNNTLLTEQVNITFLCYSVSDGVYVTSCGSLDGDYTAPTTTTTISGGGGGSSSTKIELAMSSEDLQLVRGKQNELIILFKNKNLEKPLTNLFLKVSGKIAKYIQINPETIHSLGPGEEINLTLTILSPTYIDLGTQEIILTITGRIGFNNYRETKKITLEIHELSGEEAKQLLEDSRDLIKRFEEANLSSDYLTELLNQSEMEIKVFNYELVRDNHKIIENQVTIALKAKEIIKELTQLILIAEQKGIETQDSSRLLKLSLLSLNRQEFRQSYERAKDAQMAYALEVKGEIGKISYYLKNYPQQISLIVFFVMFLGFGTYKINKVRRIKKKIKQLKNEELMLGQLIELVQKETFKEKKMSMDEYKTAIEQYQQKLSRTTEQLIELENKRAHALKFSSKNKKLLDEKTQLIKLVKQLQDDYLKKGKIETKSYELRLKSYNQRLTYIEEISALLEAKREFRRSWKFWNILRVPKGERL